MKGQYASAGNRVCLILHPELRSPGLSGDGDRKLSLTGGESGTGFSVNPNVYIYINIIVMSRHPHGYPWPSLATPPYRPLLPAGLWGYIPYQDRAVVCKFGLVLLLLLVHVKGSTGLNHLWACSYSSSSVPHVWFV